MSEIALELIAKEKKEKTGRLDLGGCGLTEIPKEVFELTWLEVLIFSMGYEDRNQCSILSSNSMAMPNRVWSIPPDIRFLQKLKELHFGGLRFHEGEPEDGRYSATMSSLSNISELRHLNSLEVLDLRNNFIRNIKPLSNLQNLELLNIENNKISDFECLNQLNKLKSLDISSNKLDETRWLVGLTRLTFLRLDYCGIFELDFLKSVKNLKTISLQYNGVKDASLLSELVDLAELYLTENPILLFPDFNKLGKLRKLGLDSTGFSNLSLIENLSNIELLMLTQNEITNVISFDCMPNLKLLDLSENEISDLTLIKGTIKQIGCSRFGSTYKNKDTGVILGANPWTVPPLEIVEQGEVGILKYFEELERQGSVPISEAKLLILGEGGAGKTSLARRLIDPSCAMPKEKDTTMGIDILHYDFKLDNEENFRANIWDFGGQEIYHSTHQFFLTKRSLYILLDDTRKDDKTVNDASFNYWLRVVELLSENSPVLIVQNEKSDRSKALDLKSMQAQFGNIKGSWATNIQTCRNLNEVREAINYHIQQLPHVGEMLPRQWVEIRKALEKLAISKDNIDLDEYYQICAEHQIPEEDRALMLSGYLHDLGTFLHFQDDLVLSDLFILKNTWATDAVYKVLDNEEVKANHGYLTKKGLIRIWNEKKYKSKRPQLLALMEKFQLCYQMRDATESTWLAPQLLPVAASDFEWDSTGSIKLKYWFDFMPKGLFSRFFVRMNRYVDEPEKAWRSGVFLMRDNTEAFIQEVYGSREISIEVKGDYPQELMTLISEEFDAINKGYGEKLRFQKLVPCVCDVCSKNAKPQFYDFENLRRRRNKGKLTVECDVSYEDVQVTDLLAGVFIEVDQKNARHYSGVKTIELFLASSNELEKDRREVEIWVRRENKELIRKGLFLSLNIWEDFLESMSNTRKQDDYNRVVEGSDVFIGLFATKVGKYSEEEFKVAFENFKADGRTKYVYTYFKNQQVGISEINPKDFDGLNRFKEYLKTLEHFPSDYETSEGLILSLKEQLKKILMDMGLE